VLIVISVWAGSRVKASEQGVLAAASGGGGDAVPATGGPVSDSSGTGTPPAASAVPYIPSGSERLPQLLFALLLLAIFAYGAASSYGLSFLGAVFPMSTSLLMIAFVGYAVLRILKPGSSKSALFDLVISDRASGEDDSRGIWRSAFWFVLLMAMTALLGFVLALTIFVIAFLRLRAELSIAKSLIYCAACVIFMMFLGHMLTLDFPAGLLQRMVDLPWPLR